MIQPPLPQAVQLKMSYPLVLPASRKKEAAVDVWTCILEMSSGYERGFITYLGRCSLHDYTNFWIKLQSKC